MSSAIQGCQIFPANNIWNVRIDGLPVQANSAALIAEIQAAVPDQVFIRCDDAYFVNIVPPGTPLVPVGGGNPQSDPGGYAIPPGVVVETGTDAHCLMIDPVAGILYELYNTVGAPNGPWSAGSAAKWDLSSNALRPDGWTSADAAGLPMIPGILRYTDVLSGAVTHCLRVTVSPTLSATYQWPARHYASQDPTVTNPMMGQRFRLQAAFDISGFSPNMQIVLTGLKQYGCMVSDNGIEWGMQHDQDARWDPADLVTLHTIAGTNMEAVDVSSLMVDPNSGATSIIPNSVFMSDALGRSNPVPLGYHLGVVAGALREFDPQQYVNQPCTINADGSWSYGRGRNVQIWRNGILQTPGANYTLNAAAFSITPIFPVTTGVVTFGPWSASDSVVAAYLF